MAAERPRTCNAAERFPAVYSSGQLGKMTSAANGRFLIFPPLIACLLSLPPLSSSGHRVAALHQVRQRQDACGPREFEQPQSGKQADRQQHENHGAGLSDPLQW